MNRLATVGFVIAAVLVALGLDLSMPMKQHAFGQNMPVAKAMPVALAQEADQAAIEEEPALASPPADEFDGLLVPRDFQDRINLWKMVYGQYDSTYLIVYNNEHPGIIYEVVKDYRGSRKKALERIRTRLFALHHIVVKSTDPVAEIKARPDADALLALYSKFESIPGQDRFALAANKGRIGVLRGRSNELMDAISRAAPYLPAMEEIFRENGLPPQLTRMVFVESMFDRRAESSKSAAGVWQIIPSAARPYLVISRSIDQRRDPIASSRAAARILQKDHQRLGSWPLAVTAYNAGSNRILRAVRKTGSSSLADIIHHYDHKAIGFAVENFYARVLAVISAEKMLGEDRLINPRINLDPLDYELVSLPRQYTLEDLSRRLGMDREILIAMNPAWTRLVETSAVPVPQGYLLRVPTGSGPLVRYFLGAPHAASTRPIPDTPVASAH